MLSENARVPRLSLKLAIFLIGLVAGSASAWTLMSARMTQMETHVIEIDKGGSGALREHLVNNAKDFGDIKASMARIEEGLSSLHALIELHMVYDPVLSHSKHGTDDRNGKQKE